MTTVTLNTFSTHKGLEVPREVRLAIGKWMARQALEPTSLKKALADFDHRFFVVCRQQYLMDEAGKKESYEDNLRTDIDDVLSAALDDSGNLTDDWKKEMVEFMAKRAAIGIKNSWDASNSEDEGRDIFMNRLLKITEEMALRRLEDRQKDETYWLKDAVDKALDRNLEGSDL